MTMTATAFTYVGDELDLFAAATNWKSYFRRRLLPYLGRSVLEVGAGFGGTTRLLCQGDFDRWVCLEPDAALAGRLADAVRRGELPACCRPEVGTIAQIPEGPDFDTVLYMDVLEHIEDDAGEVARAAKRLRPGGHVIALSPAHQWLFTPFDEAIGHFRRYTRKTFGALKSPDLDVVRLDYLDSVGMLASLGNRLVLNRSMPNPKQISAWDKLMVPVSKVVDPILGYSLGKSVFAVWRKR